MYNIYIILRECPMKGRDGPNVRVSLVHFLSSRCIHLTLISKFLVKGQDDSDVRVSLFHFLSTWWIYYNYIYHQDDPNFSVSLVYFLSARCI